MTKQLTVSGHPTPQPKNAKEAEMTRENEIRRDERELLADMLRKKAAFIKSAADVRSIAGSCSSEHWNSEYIRAGGLEFAAALISNLNKTKESKKMRNISIGTYEGAYSAEVDGEQVMSSSNLSPVAFVTGFLSYLGELELADMEEAIDGQ